MVSNDHRHEPAVGDRVFFTSGRQLGKVIERADGCFKVASDADVHWLRLDSVYMRDDVTVTLVCEAHGLPNYFSPDPHCTEHRAD
ncbi:MAG: hypothetical protein ACR2HN_13965 [Tepidiformaceae bacterium]